MTKKPKNWIRMGEPGVSYIEDKLSMHHLLHALAPEARTVYLDHVQGALSMLAALDAIDDDQYAYWHSKIEDRRG